MSTAEKCIEDLKLVLWPPGEEDEDWSLAQTLDDVVDVLRQHGYLDDIIARGEL